MDNTLKVLLGVLGFAGVLTVLATTLNIPGTLETDTPAAVAAPAAAPLPSTMEADPNASNSEVVDGEDVTDEEINSFGEPSIELPNEPEEEETVSDVGPTPPYNGPAIEDDSSAAPAAPSGE